MITIDDAIQYFGGAAKLTRALGFKNTGQNVANWRKRPNGNMPEHLQIKLYYITSGRLRPAQMPAKVSPTQAWRDAHPGVK